MRSATALSIVSAILVVKATLIGWVSWGRARTIGYEPAAGQAGLVIASVVLAVALVAGVSSVVLRRRERDDDRV
jgi:Zn-dependent protease with chaperone function